MNDLSWMLYWADVVDNVSAVCASVAIGGVLGGIAATIAVGIKTDLDNIRAKEKRHALSEGWGAGRKFFLVALAAAAISTPIPSRDTIYAIAASEMGEEALKSPIATKAGKALEKWLDDQLKDEESAK